MPRVEIEETAFQQSEALRQTVQGMLQNPDSRKLLLKAQKTAFPKTVIPEVDAQEPINSAVEQVGKRLDDIAKQLETDKQERQKEKAFGELQTAFNAGRAKLRAAGYTDEGIAAVEKLMEERALFDHEVGAALHEKIHPPAAPATPAGFNTWNFFDTPKEGEDNLKKLLDSKGEDDGVVRSMVNDALASVRGTSVRR